MTHDLHHLREQALRARWWAVSIVNPVDRERLETIAREYEQQIRAVEREDRAINAPGIIGRRV
jgi:hypothetical protein